MAGAVVFPTAIEERAGGLDVYYGMADSRIGVVHLAPMLAAADEVSEANEFAA